MARTENLNENVILESVPKNINDSEILHLLYSADINWQYLSALKNYTDFKDDTISDWLNISVKTFREYKKPQSSFKEIIRHGVDVFGSVKEFDLWLNQENFFFDNKAPISYMNTITGIRYIDDRLTALEYGDNV
jgi:hypothetical protein